MSPENSNWLVQMYIFPSEVVPLKRGHSFVSGWCSLATNPPIRSISLPGGAKRTTRVPQTLVFAFWAAEKMGGKFFDGYTTPRSGWNIIPGRVPGMVGVMDFSLNHPDETRSFKLKVKHTKPEVEQRVCP